MGLWRNRTFLLLWGGQTAGELGARISGVAVPLLAGDLGRAALMLSLPMAALTARLTLALLYVVVCLTGILTVLFTVAYRTEVPRIVAPESLVEANAKVTMSQDLADRAGPALAGALIGLAGAARTFVANGAVYLLSATCFALIRTPATSYRQRVTPAPLLGRVNASFLWICYGAIPLGSLFGGALATQAGIRPALLVSALGMWGAGLFVLFSPLRTMRDLPEPAAVR